MQKIIILNKSELVKLFNYVVDAAIEHGDDDFNNNHDDVQYLINKLNDVDIIGDENNLPSINFEIDNTK